MMIGQLGMDNNTNDTTKKYREALLDRVGEAKYKTWFSDICVSDVSNDSVLLLTGSRSKMEMLDHRWLPLMTDTWRSNIGPVEKLRLGVGEKLSDFAAKVERQMDAPAAKAADMYSGANENGESAQRAAFAKAVARPANTNGEARGTDKAAQAEAALARASVDISTPIDERKTFDNYALAPSNEMAWAAARQAFVDTGAREIIYIHGPSGSGKSHLLQAIGNEWTRSQSGLAAYVTYNNLYNACVGAVWSNSIQDLHQQLLQYSLLQIDDVHLLEGKNRTQEELLNLIDAFQAAGKQIVLAGEVAPAKLAAIGMHQRLVDRLSGGLSAGINVADETLRLEVLKKTLEGEAAQCKFDDEALAFVARNFANSMRETIGALKQVLLMYRTKPVRVGLDEVKQLLRARMEDGRQVATLEDAIVAGAKAFGVEVDEVMGRAQPQRIVRARHAIVYCAREVLRESFPRIGKALKRDHTTSMSSYRRAQALIERDKAFQDGVQRIREKLEG